MVSYVCYFLAGCLPPVSKVVTPNHFIKRQKLHLQKRFIKTIEIYEYINIGFLYFNSQLLILMF